MVTISSLKTKAVIFDMDGTMIENMNYHKQAWQAFLEKHNIILTEKEFSQKISGKKNDQILRIIFGDSISEDQLGAYASEKEALYRTLYAPHIVEVAGLSGFIAKLHKKGIKTAIATTAPRSNRDFGLQQLKLKDSFEVILGDEHVSKGKPDPEIYLATAKQLNVLADECIVIEDSPPGVASGKNAKMHVIAITTSHARKDLLKADEFIKTFNEVVVSGPE